MNYDKYLNNFFKIYENSNNNTEILFKNIDTVIIIEDNNTNFQVKHIINLYKYVYSKIFNEIDLGESTIHYNSETNILTLVYEYPKKNMWINVAKQDYIYTEKNLIIQLNIITKDLKYNFI
jgi:hypothetical protein